MSGALRTRFLLASVLVVVSGCVGGTHTVLPSQPVDVQAQRSTSRSMSGFRNKRAENRNRFPLNIYVPYTIVAGA